MTLWHCDTVILWYYGTMILWHCDTVILWHYDTVTWWHFDTVTLWYCDTMAMILWHDDTPPRGNTSWVGGGVQQHCSTAVYIGARPGLKLPFKGFLYKQYLEGWRKTSGNKPEIKYKQTYFALCVENKWFKINKSKLKGYMTENIFILKYYHKWCITSFVNIFQVHSQVI